MPVMPGYIGNRFRLVAQLDRASGFEPEGWGFESLRAGHSPIFLVFSRLNGGTDRNHSGATALFGSRMGVIMAHWSNELRIDPVVWATALFGVITAAILVTAI
jgi:hypothetical protein